MTWLIKLLFRIIAVIVISSTTSLLEIADGSTKEKFIIAGVFAIVLGLLNTFIKPILSLFALPITFITLGLFQLVINTVVVILAARVVDGIHIDGFLNAFLFSILFSVISWAIEQVASDKK